MKLEYTVKPWVSEMIDYFWENRKHCLSNYDVIDYPDYYGLPKEISSELSSDLVDILQYCLIDLLNGCKTKKTFASELIDCLSREMIKVKKG